MTKQQRLRNVAEGLMAGLVANGFTGPWHWAHHQWEGVFYRVWRDWPPAQRDPASFPTFQLGGGAGRTSQARDMLWTLKSTSPFHDHDRKPLTMKPRGMTPVEYLEIWVTGAHADEWIDLARKFLAEMER